MEAVESETRMTTAAAQPVAPAAPPLPSKGLEGIVAANTRLSDVKGEIGELIYAGYNINELAGKVSFEEVVHLLHENRLPNRAELGELKKTLAANRKLPAGGVDILRGVPKEKPPMHAGKTGLSALGCFDARAGYD